MFCTSCDIFFVRKVFGMGPFSADQKKHCLCGRECREWRAIEVIADTQIDENVLVPVS